MMEFSLNIRMDNAAFCPCPTAELARILEMVSGKVASGSDDGPVMDINGNTVGHYSISEGERR